MLFTSSFAFNLKNPYLHFTVLLFLEGHLTQIERLDCRPWYPASFAFQKANMKTLINILAVATLLFTVNFSANAQKSAKDRPARPEPAEMAKTQTADLAEKLNLDEAQTAKVEEINLAHAVKMKKARENNSGGREAMKAIRAEHEANKTYQMKKVLTEEQFATYKAMEPKKAVKAVKGAASPERM